MRITNELSLLPDNGCPRENEEQRSVSINISNVVLWWANVALFYGYLESSWVYELLHIINMQINRASTISCLTVSVLTSKTICYYQLYVKMYMLIGYCAFDNVL